MLFNQNLTICMPSFNRPFKAIESVKRILPQALKKNVQIIVLDNASNEKYLTLFKKEPDLQLALQTGVVSIRRNSVNIGMSANFLRAFEIVDTEWLWLVSDDDDIYLNAVDVIFNAINCVGESYDFIKFSSVRIPQFEDLPIDNIEQFIDYNAISKDNFNSFIFISNGLYRIKEFRKFVQIGYAHANTFVPHFLMMASLLSQGGRMLIHRGKVVDYVVPESGYSYGLVAGLGVGASKSILLDLTPKYTKRFYSLFFPHNDFKVIVDLFFHCNRNASKSVYRYLCKNYIFLALYARSAHQIFFLRILFLLSYSSLLFKFIIYLLELVSPRLKKQINEIKNRYT